MSRPSTRPRTSGQGHDRPGVNPPDPRPCGDHPAAGCVPRGRHGRVREPRRMREREGGLGSERVAGQRVRRLDDPGLRHVDERQRRRDDPLQGQVDRLGLPHRHLSAGLLPGQRRAPAAGQRPPDGEPAPDSARLPDRCGDGPDRLRQLGRVGVVDGPVHLGLGRLHRQADTRRQRRREPDPVRGPRRRGALGHAGEDLRLDVAGLQQVRRQQPVLVHRAVPAGQPGRLQGGVLGLLQPPLRRDHHAGQRPLVPVLRRVPDDPVPRAQRLRRELHEPGRRRGQRRAPAQPQGHPLQRPRRVLVRPGAHQRRGRPRRRRQPRVLQRQRGVLEDPLAVEQRRRHRDAEPHADDLQGHALQRADRSHGLDGHVARPALRGRRRQQARERAHRPAVHHQLGLVGHHGALDLQEPAAVAQHGGGEPRRRPVANPGSRQPDAGLRVGPRRRQRLPPARHASSSRRRPSAASSRSPTSAPSPSRARPRPTTSPSTRRPAARSSSEPARCSGRGASTTPTPGTTTGRPPAPRRIPSCSRRR